MPFYRAPYHFLPSRFHIMPQPPFTQVANVNRATTPTSAFVVVLARALSSVGFALSLIAIWVGWFLPVPKPPQGRTPNVSKSLSQYPHNRRASAPVTLTPILEPRQEGDQVVPNHVYFADRESAAVQRRNTLPVEKSNLEVSEKPPQNGQFNPITVASPPSMLTPPSTPPLAKLTFDGTDGSAIDSDSSRHSSMASLLLPSARLPKLKLGFSGKGKRPVGNKHVDPIAPVKLEHEESVKSARRTSGGFSVPWSASRGRTTTETTKDSEPQTVSASRLSFTRCFSPTRSNTCPSPSSATFTCTSRKAQRRTSTPIPRTSPYAAPYFASPPVVLDDTYSGYLRGLPQFEDEVSLTPKRSAIPGEFGEKNSHGWDQSHFTAPTQGRFPRGQRAISKRRSASESWATRSPVSS